MLRGLIVVFGVCGVILLASVASGQPKTPVLSQPQTLVEPGTLAILLSGEEVVFNVDGPPGAYETEVPVDLLVQSGCGAWVVSCSAGPLVSDVGEIPPERILLAGAVAYGPAADGVAQDYQSLGEPQVVARGGFTGLEPVKVNTLMLRLLTTWMDEPGTYRGSITFTYLCMP